MSHNFCLKWNDYQSNWCKALTELHRNTDYADVTLVTDDKVKFSAHKIVLSSCSNTFKFILKELSHANPLIYLNGISSVNLGFILEYIYKGEVNIYQEHLESFLKSSEKLEIEGLLELLSGQKEQENPENLYSEENLELRDEENEQESSENLYSEENVELSEEKEQESQKNLYSEENMELKVEEKEQESPEANMELKEDLQYQSNEEKANKRKDFSKEAKRALRQLTAKKCVNKIDVSSMTPEESSRKMLELYKKIDGVWRCLACEYGNRMIYKMKRHIEIHIDGLSYNCDLCHKDFRQKNLLDNHISSVHRK